MILCLPDELDNPDELNKRTHAYKTLRRSKRLSKKLKHRLSIRTAAEVLALKKDVHILFYAAELIAKNPKEAYDKFQELWSYLR